MDLTFSLYRKAIAALIAGFLPLLASHLPGAAAYLDPTAVNVLSVVLAALAVAATADKLDGARVVDLAKIVVAAFDHDSVEINKVPKQAAVDAARQGDLVIPRGAGRDPLVVTPIRAGEVAQ